MSETYLERVGRLYGVHGEWDYCYSSYGQMLDDFGTILVQVDDDDYQGDSRVLYRKDDKYGFLIFGWGSCSGCDSLQACNSQQEVAELMESLESSIKWCDTLDELVDYLHSDDRSLNYYAQCDEWKEFVEKVEQYKNNGSDPDETSSSGY